MAATFTLLAGIAIQAVVLSVYLALRNPAILFAIFRVWKPSLSASFAGAVASQFWFLAFALTTAASVRTLALIEVLFAHLVARIAFGQRTSAREALGMLLVVGGVALLLIDAPAGQLNSSGRTGSGANAMPSSCSSSASSGVASP